MIRGIDNNKLTSMVHDINPMVHDIITMVHDIITMVHDIISPKQLIDCGPDAEKCVLVKSSNCLRKPCQLVAVCVGSCLYYAICTLGIKFIIIFRYHFIDISILLMLIDYYIIDYYLIDY